MDREAWHAAIRGVTKSWTDWASALNWVELRLPGDITLSAFRLQEAWGYVLLIVK